MRAIVDAVARRRAEGMHRFVESYRAFARAPELRRRRFDAAAWARKFAQLLTADPAARGVALMLDVEAGALLDADPELLAQLCLNLLRNAATASLGHAAAPASVCASQPVQNVL